MQVTAQRFWSPPAVERAVAALVATATSYKYKAGEHFHLVTREAGSERHDLPIWATAPGALAMDDSGWGPVKRTDVAGVPGAFVLSNVLTDSECDRIAAISEDMGYTEDAPVSLSRSVRRNENCVVIADDSLWKPIWRRVRGSMPAAISHPAGECSTPLGLNQRWRLYKYGEEDIFRMHTDGSWPGSGLVNGKLVRDIYGDRWSQLTFLLYLDADYEGGETRYIVMPMPMYMHMHMCMDMTCTWAWTCAYACTPCTCAASLCRRVRPAPEAARLCACPCRAARRWSSSTGSTSSRRCMRALSSRAG